MKLIEACIAPTRLAQVSWLVALAFLAASSTRAAAETVEKKIEKKKETYSAGQKVAIDPETRKLRAPTPEESAALEARARPTVVPTVTPTVLPNGTLKADLPEDYMDATVVQKNPDGTLTMHCLRGMAAADALGQTESNAKASAAKPAGQTTAPPTDKGVKNPAELEKE